MKEGLVVKANWILFRKSIQDSLYLLGVNEPKSFYREVSKTYHVDLRKIPEFGENDILKINLVHAVMLGAIYKHCDPKPNIDALTEFYRSIILKPSIVTWTLNHLDMLKPSAVKKEIRRGERSQKATNPFTWQYTINVEDENRYTANFTKCGIFEYLSSQGMAEIIPAMCAMDYTFAEKSNHFFLRNHTIATKGNICDCHYIRKTEATEEEKDKFLNDQKNEALRGGLSR